MSSKLALKVLAVLVALPLSAQAFQIRSNAVNVGCKLDSPAQYSDVKVIITQGDRPIMEVSEGHANTESEETMLENSLMAYCASVRNQATNLNKQLVIDTDAKGLDTALTIDSLSCK